MAKHHKGGKPARKHGRGGRHPGPAGAPSLVSLAIARTGREMDTSMLQITEPEPFARMNNQLMSAMMGWVRQGKRLEDVEQATSTHEQEDGSLIIYSNVDGSQVAIAKGSWRLLSAEQMAEIKGRLEQREDRSVGVGGKTRDDGVGMLADSMRQSIRQDDQQQDIFRKAIELADQCVLVLDRSSVSLNGLNHILGPQLPKLKQKADEWLEGGQPYAVLSHGKDPVARWLVGVPTRAALLGPSLVEIADVVDDIASCMLMSRSLRDADLARAVETRWHELGGLTPTREGTSRGAAAAPTSPVGTALGAGKMDHSPLVIDHSDRGMQALADRLASVGSETREIEAVLAKWRESTARYLVFSPGRGLKGAEHGEDLAKIIEGVVLDLMSGGPTAIYLAREVSQDHLDEVKAAIAKGTELAATLNAARKHGTKAVEWMQRSFDGMSLQVRRGDGDPVCMVTFEPGVVKGGRTQGLIDLLNAMVQDGVSLFASRDSLLLVTPDYDDDPRALYDVPEARQFARDVVAQCPWWQHAFHMDHPEISSVRWLALSVVESTTPAEAGHDDGAQGLERRAKALAQVFERADEAVGELYVKACETKGLNTIVAASMLEAHRAQVARMLEVVLMGMVAGEAA